MKISIVGAGPVGLLLSCLLSLNNHDVTVLDKRNEHTRNHGLRIDADTVNTIITYLNSLSLSNSCPLSNSALNNILNSWVANSTIRTSEIESQLADIATNLGVTIRRGVQINSLTDISDHIVIGADGAHSTIRRLAFNNEIVDEHTVQYMALLKFETAGGTRPRSPVATLSYSMINSITGPDIVVDFESLAPSNDTYRKPGTLHIPIPKQVYDILAARDTHNVGESLGSHMFPWTLNDLLRIDHPQIAKLCRVIKRYKFSLNFRGGNLEHETITVIPLTIYRSDKVVKFIDKNLYMLVGDASSGLVYEKGLNKGWLEAVQCAQALSPLKVDSLKEYSNYCQAIFDTESADVFHKQRKIVSSSHIASAVSSGLIITALIGAGFLLTKEIR